MSRLQQKCFIASVGFHLLPVLILFIGPGFLTSNKKSEPDNMPILDFVAMKTTDDMRSGGGENVKSAPMAAPLPPPPAPPAPAPKQPEKQPDPEPIKEPAKTPDSEEHSLEPAKTTKRRKIEVSTTPTVRKRNTQDEAQARAAAEARAEAQRWAESRQRLAKVFGETAENIGNGLSGGTSIKLQGPGGGGVPYANFLQAVKSVYTHAWVVPEGVTDDDATVTASVTIARDGSVISSRISRSSGNSAVDRSVQATLNRVHFAAPLPDSATEDQRTVSINFNVRAKRALG